PVRLPMMPEEQDPLSPLSPPEGGEAPSAPGDRPRVWPETPRPLKPQLKRPLEEWLEEFVTRIKDQDARPSRLEPARRRRPRGLARIVPAPSGASGTRRPRQEATDAGAERGRRRGRRRGRDGGQAEGSASPPRPRPQGATDGRARQSQGGTQEERRRPRPSRSPRPSRGPRPQRPPRA